MSLVYRVLAFHGVLCVRWGLNTAPAGERKTEAPTGQFDKYRGLNEKMDPRHQSCLGGISKHEI